MYQLFVSEHSLKQCTSHYTSRECRGTYHTVLHKEKSLSSISPSSAHSAPTGSAPSTTSSSAAGQVLTATGESTGFFTTALMTVTARGYSHHARGVLGSAATLSLVTSRLANSIKARRHRCDVEVQGLNENTRSNSYVVLQLQSLYPPEDEDDDDFLELKCYIVDTMMPPLPRRSMSNVKQLDVVKNAKPLADPAIGGYGHVGLLLGANGVGPAYRDITKQSPDRTVTITWTLFGWMVGGTIPAASPILGRLPSQSTR